MSEKTKIAYDVTNVLEKIKQADITYTDVNFNLIPEILVYYHDELIPAKRFDNPFKKGFKHEISKMMFDFLAIMKNFNHNNIEAIDYLKKKLLDHKDLNEKDFDYLLKDTKLFIKIYNERLDMLEGLIENDFGNITILTNFKTTIQNGSFLTESDERYFLFCTLDFEKNKIHKSGKVPIGWLPSDLVDLYEFSNQNMGKLSKNQRNANLVNAFLHWNGSRF